jgi:SAM-dependent methyltransferase
MGRAFSSITSDVSDYYGKVLSNSDDLQTNACTTGGDMPRHVKQALSNVHDEVLAKYYGCGLTIPTTLKGQRVLDLGSGSGRDCYAIAQMVGEDGFVLGVDMTDEQLEVATRTEQWHADKFGYERKNTEFKKGYIERLDELGLEDNSFDIVVSNCVINLSPDKDAVLREVYRVLKPGGELYFSDVYADKRVSQELRDHKVLWGECVSGALYWNDFIAMSKKHGFLDPRLVEDSVITINNPTLQPLVDHIGFYSATYRLWKLPELEHDCEDYGQAVIYKGTIAEMPKTFLLDAHHRIDAGRIFPVCGNTYNMLAQTRLAPHFEFIGDFSTHYGQFPCGAQPDTPTPFASASAAAAGKAGPSSCC